MNLSIEKSYVSKVIILNISKNERNILLYVSIKYSHDVL